MKKKCELCGEDMFSILFVPYRINEFATGAKRYILCKGCLLSYLYYVGDENYEEILK
jgi:hypothetical protein